MSSYLTRNKVQDSAVVIHRDWVEKAAEEWKTMWWKLPALTSGCLRQCGKIGSCILLCHLCLLSDNQAYDFIISLNAVKSKFEVQITNTSHLQIKKSAVEAVGNYYFLHQIMFLYCLLKQSFGQIGTMGKTVSSRHCQYWYIVHLDTGHHLQSSKFGRIHCEHISIWKLNLSHLFTFTSYFIFKEISN